ncbi:MAG: uroporphyrinogen-III synthase [Caulobacteraceae bacterium]|nr:uroporphyrinogen-III synthase [Caulobacteraceae bacterium]
MSGPRRIWVTRSEPQAQATARRLRAMGLEPVVRPLLMVRLRPEAHVDLEDVQAIAFTSGHGVRAFAGLSLERGLPVFAVGGATAAAARACGFSDVRVAGGDVRALAEAIADAGPRPRRVFNPAALEPAADLAALLAARGVEVRTIAVYETIPAPAAAPPDVQAVLVHSPKAARALAALATPDWAARVSAFAISPAAAQPLSSPPFARLRVAQTPDEASLLALLAEAAR